MEDLAAAHRTLFGNVLIAEGECLHVLSLGQIWFRVDNPIAQNLLVKQLQRYHLNVTATGDGEEAILGMLPSHIRYLCLLTIAEWESHEPGYFSVALFDHRKFKKLFASFSLTMLFIDMPLCDGVEATKRLRNLEAKRKTQVILPSMIKKLKASPLITNILP